MHISYNRVNGCDETTASGHCGDGWTTTRRYGDYLIVYR